MAKSNDQPGSSSGPYADSPVAAPAPKPGSKAQRWFKIILLGVGLGGIYTVYNLSLMTLPQLGPTNEITRVEIESVPFMLADEKLQQQLIKVIQSQLAAFRQEDYTTAYTFAAADFKAQISRAAFERMVKTGFPQIARSRSAEYGIILENGSDARVEVTIVGENGTRIHYQYVLHRERGGWKIGGVNEGPSEKSFI